MSSKAGEWWEEVREGERKKKVRLGVEVRLDLCGMLRGAMSRKANVHYQMQPNVY